MSDRVGHSVNWGPVTTHHARSNVVLRPFLSVRAWLMLAAALLVSAVLLAVTVGSSAGVPAFVASVVAAYIALRAAHKWREYNRVVATNRAKEQRAQEDEQDRANYRQWLRDQVGRTGE